MTNCVFIQLRPILLIIKQWALHYGFVEVLLAEGVDILVQRLIDETDAEDIPPGNVHHQRVLDYYIPPLTSLDIHGDIDYEVMSYVLTDIEHQIFSQVSVDIQTLYVIRRFPTYIFAAIK